MCRTRCVEHSCARAFTSCTVNSSMISSAAGLQPAKLIIIMSDWCLGGWMDGCLSSNFFQTCTPFTVFVQFLRKLASMIYVPIRKNCGTDFWDFAFIILANLKKNYVSSKAVNADRPPLVRIVNCFGSKTWIHVTLVTLHQLLGILVLHCKSECIYR